MSKDQKRPNGSAAIRRIHLLGFVEEVRHIHANMPDRRFCFVLGAGASKTSLIPTAGELGLEWLRKIHTERGGAAGDFAKWLREGTHGIEELPPKTSITDIAAIAAAYPAIYFAKWGHDRAQGHAEIERHIEAARASYGYYALAEILASDDPANPSRHNVVITPNFDNLPAETLGALGKKIPIVIGHSAITDFARPTLRRPLIIKFHHDFLLAPKSDPNDVGRMEKGYSQALSEIFRLYTPIVIGYGGNDGSLMGLLEGLENPIPGGILWCWRTGDPAGQRIEGVVAKQAGTLIEISGFDELMTLLEKPFGHVFKPDKLRERADARAQELKEAHERLSKKAESALSPAAASSAGGERSGKPPITPAASEESAAVLDALRAASAVSKPAKPKEKASLTWWHWQTRINATTDLDKQEQLFKEGLEATTNAFQLLCNYAIFLQTQRKDDDRAEEFYQKALAADSNEATILGSYASFLETQRKDDDRAEEFYRKALAADPNNANNLGNYASFLQTQRKDDDRAEEYFQKALAADPNHANKLGNYASFLQTQRKDYDRAEEYFQKALAADPNHANNLGNYASFLADQRKDYDRAEEYFQKALAADPNSANNLGNYLQFLIGRTRLAEAVPLANRAWALLSDWSEMGAGEVAFSRWLLAAVAGRDGQPALGRLKTLLQAGYERAPWSFDAMLAACLPKLHEKEHALARKLADAILDETKLPELNADPDWLAVQPIALDAPWPDDPVPDEARPPSVRGMRTNPKA